MLTLGGSKQEMLLLLRLHLGSCHISQEDYLPGMEEEEVEEEEEEEQKSYFQAEKACLGVRGEMGVVVVK